MVKIVKQIMAVFIVLIVMGCSLFPKTIYVEVQDNYSGWCYLIPVEDSSIVSQRKGRAYILNSAGVAHIPASELDIAKTNVIKIFSSGKEVTGEDKYTGLVHKVSKDGTKYNYFQFYLASSSERNIDDDAYWRDRSYEKNLLQRFDSLVKQGVIRFR